MITKEKKSHNIGQALIKPCVLKLSDILLDTTYRKKMVKISLSDSTIKTHIDELAKKCEVLTKLQVSLFLIQDDETTDIAQSSQLLVYVCFN